MCVDELSDGTLRYLLLTAALLSPDPPRLLVLNEPKTSLHPDLLPALTRLVIECSRRTQMMVITHSKTLASLLSDLPNSKWFKLEKVFGAMKVSNVGQFDGPRWKWPPR